MKYKLLLVAFVLFTTNMLFSQSVVVNKYRNVGTAADIVELLVVQDNADLRNLVFKSFSSNNTADGGGSFTFNNIPFWNGLRAGTLIVITNSIGGVTATPSPDIATSCTDFNLSMLAKGDSGAYFTVGLGTFDLANNDMCMLKSGTTTGVANNIHTLLAGSSGVTTQWFGIASGTRVGTSSLTTGTTADIVYVTNALSVIGDYNLGTTVGAATIGGSATMSFGVGNNATNTAFINFLRGPVSSAATAVNISSFSANWGAVTGATSYRLDVSTSSTFASFVSGYSDLNVGNVTTYSVTGLSPGTPYYYRVRAVNVTPTTSGNSCTQTLTTLNGKVSVASGDWNTAATWNPVGVPVAADNVVISTGHIVSTSIPITGVTARTGTTTVDGTFQLNAGGWVSGTAFTYNATTGGLNFNDTAIYDVNNTDTYWPTTLPPFNVSVLQGGMRLNSMTRTVAGTFTAAGSVAMLTSTLNLTGTCQVNTGASFTNTPVYGNASTLVYNNTFTVGNEWTGNSTTAGTGIPQNVTIQNSANVTMPNGGGSRGMAGNLNIASGNLILGNTSGDDLYVAGNWTRASGATFTPNNRAVYFNAPTAVNQTVTVSASGTETFNYLRVQGIGTLKLATGTNAVVNASSGLTLGSTNATSTIDLNGQTLTLSGGGNLDLSAGAKKITSTLAGGKVIITTADLTVTNGGSLSTDTNTLIDLQKGLDCGTGSLVTINGTLQINANGFSTGNSPRYGASSLLQYNNGTSYNRQLEWTSTTAVTGGIGAPNNVQISNNTTFNYYNASNNGAKSIVGNLLVDIGSTFNMGTADIGGPLTVPGNVTNNGTLSLCTVYNILENDLKLAGNLTNTGTFNGNGRAVFFTNNGTLQTITSSAGITIPYVRLASAGNTNVKLATGTNLTISAPLASNAIIFSNSGDVFDINGNTLTIGTDLIACTISGPGSFKGSTASNLTLKGTGNIGTVKFGPLAADMNLGTFVMNRTSSGGCTMGSAVTVNTALTLTSGIIDLGANTMTLETAVPLLITSSASSYLIADVSVGGILRRRIAQSGVAATNTYDFPVGSGGTQYTPAKINFTAGTFTTAYLGIAVENSKEPNMDASTNYINRYWEVTTSGTFTTPTYTFIGTFINSAFPATGDVTGTATTSKANQWNGTAWTIANGANVIVPNITAAGITTLPTVNHFTAGQRDAEINIRQGATTYLTGSTYTFLQTNVGSPQIVTFNIQNLGNQTLACTTGTLTGTYYTTAYVNPTNVLSGGSTNFTVTFTPLTAGTFTGSISIANNDATGSENPYVINFTCEAVCSPAPVNTITPTSGPPGTEVTITATNATDFTGGATVTFLGTVATSTTTSGTTIIKAIVPSGVINGQGTVTTVTNTLGCIASNTFTVDKNVTNTCQGGTNLSDLIISEVTDSTYGGLTYVEIYNGTGASVDLTANAYSLQFFANGSATSYATQALSGTLANGATYTVDTSLSGFSCTVTGGDGSLGNLHSGVAGINFADSSTGNVALGHDHIGLYKGAVKKDSWGVYADQTWATSLGIGDRGADFRRKNNVTLPNTTYSNSDWDIINWSGTGTSSCSNNDYSNIGVFNFLAGSPPTVTTHPTYTPSCKTASLTVAGTEGYPTGNALAYQWYAVAPGVATWTALTDGALYSGATSATLNLLNTTTLSGYQFYCMINENTSTCHSSSNAVKIVPGNTATWNGFGWVGATPSLYNAVVINGNYDTSAIGNDSFEACSVTVNSPNVLTITSGKYVAIQNDLTVNGPSGNVIVRDDASLVQIDDNGVNNGSIDVERVASMKLSDYVYWSSPVASFPTTSVSPGTSTALIWKWNPTIANSNNGEGNWQNASADTMTAGKGYIIRAPNTFNNTTPTDLTAPFRGIPFNGIKQPSIARGDITTSPGLYPAAPYAGTNGSIISEFKDNMNLVGNPYPSSINAINFLTYNTNILGYINLWTHGSLPSISTSPYYGNYAYNYAPGDYITYNSSGVSSGPSAFSGYIASGQGFFVTMNDGAPDATQTVTFKNAMRSSYSSGTYSYFDNSNFYRNASHHNTIVGQPIERNRIWLDLIAGTGTTTRTLVGYIEGATMEMDRMFDANTSIGTSQNLYSLIGNKPYGIQGRALPFDSNDAVPLGVNLPAAATYTIAIGVTDGLFHETNQAIYLEDTALNIIHDLRVAPYVFTAEAGKFDTRFLLRYNNTNGLGTVDFENLSNSVVVTTPNHNQIAIKSYVENMNNVSVYDILGRVVYTNSQVDSKELVISNGVLNQQALIVKITLENGVVVTKKIVL